MAFLFYNFTETWEGLRLENKAIFFIILISAFYKSYVCIILTYTYIILYIWKL